MDLEKLISEGRVPLAPLVMDIAQRNCVIEAKLDVLIGLQVQIVANLENREFEDVAAGVEKNFNKSMEEATRRFNEMLANNII